MLQTWTELSKEIEESLLLFDGPMFASQNYATTIETATSFDFGPFRCFSITPVQRTSNDLLFSTAGCHYVLQDFSQVTFPWLWKLAVTCTRLQADNLRRYFQWSIKFMKRQFKESQGAACPLCHLEWTSGRPRRSSACCWRMWRITEKWRTCCIVWYMYVESHDLEDSMIPSGKLES